MKSFHLWPGVGQWHVVLYPKYPHSNCSSLLSTPHTDVTSHLCPGSPWVITEEISSGFLTCSPPSWKQNAKHKETRGTVVTCWNTSTGIWPMGRWQILERGMWPDMTHFGGFKCSRGKNIVYAHQPPLSVSVRVNVWIPGGPPTHLYQSSINNTATKATLSEIETD